MSDPSANSSSGPAGAGLGVSPSLTSKQLYNLLLTAVQHQQQQSPSTQQSAPGAPQINFPPFMVAPVTPSKSLLDAFPSLEPAMLLDIARHELRPMDLCKLDSRLREKADDSGSTSSFLSRDSSTKDNPSLSALFSPLNLYFCVLIHFASSGGKADVVMALSTGFLLYMDHLNDLNFHYDCSAVLQYHMDFHARHRRDMINGKYDGWGVQHYELLMKFLFGHERVRCSGATNSGSGSSLKSKKLPIEQQICFTWNSGNCTALLCKRLHHCAMCHPKEHTEKDCPRKET